MIYLCDQCISRCPKGHLEKSFKFGVRDHNLLFSGHPGTGNTLLASRLPGLLPPLDEREVLEAAAIQSVASHSPLTSWPQRPFRQPHHSASSPALFGGGCDISQ